MRNEKGQLVIVSRPIAPNPGIQPVVNIRPNPVPIPNQGTATPKTAQITSVTTKGSQSKPSQKGKTTFHAIRSISMELKSIKGYI